MSDLFDFSGWAGMSFRTRYGVVCKKLDRLRELWVEFDFLQAYPKHYCCLCSEDLYLEFTKRKQVGWRKWLS